MSESERARQKRKDRTKRKYGESSSFTAMSFLYRETGDGARRKQLQAKGKMLTPEHTNHVAAKRNERRNNPTELG